ncbi:uncharacterized protein ACLA_099320 [Aspergillus clavatus NRRL 1]|uniref:Integral membrane protein n=1 Tax=Aspergillus clavatus (strain ATCC 1007 / CBS 513.65 / DSM 816 / NCTC 3887 / NRRL 1 / QM 1276 / 107) TaxID=344612 RepID=A1CN50_ASPCL|nr:uncharacterized protein ACLA_099320 [Aspergillus clavatus NRRL 1]EAW08987.1 conserved hypothetical protein [Aspergillus clavatus NRRL 1]
MPNFELARQVQHLIVQPADQRLNPSESYLFVQDGLIISCGVLYALCYLFCMIRTYADKTYPGARAGSIQFLCLTMAYEVFYAFTTTTTRFEKLAFLAWFELDLSFTIVALREAHTPLERRVIRRNMIVGFLAGIMLLQILTQIYPDERQQVTAYWTGILLQFPIGWICLYLLWKDHSTRGHSLEIWLTRYLGCFTAYGVFLWRYFNVPQNWEYVWSPWSIGIIVTTLLPETIYPFVYVWVHKTQKPKKA